MKLTTPTKTELEIEIKRMLPVFKMAMRLHRLRIGIGSFHAVIAAVRGRVLIDALDRACARAERAERKHK